MPLILIFSNFALHCDLRDAPQFVLLSGIVYLLFISVIKVEDSEDTIRTEAPYILSPF